MLITKDFVLCRVQTQFNAGAATLKLQALPGSPPWRMPPVTTDAAAVTPTYGAPYITLTLMDALNLAAAKIEMIRCHFSGVETPPASGIYEATNCERGFSGTTDQVWPVGSYVLAQLGAAHLSMDMEMAVMRAQHVLTHPSNQLMLWNGSKFSWGRFRAIGVGRGVHWSADGYFDVSMPTAGTVVTGHGGASNDTFAADGIVLPQNCALYYELNIAGSAASIAGSFRLVSYSADFTVPKHWILLAVHEDNGSPGDAVLRLGTGATLVAWREVTAVSTPALLNGWVHFGAPYETPAFKKGADQVVRLKGLVKNGTVPNDIFQLPAGYRPAARVAFSVPSNATVAELHIEADGSILPINASNTYVCLDGVTFTAAA